MIECLLIAWCFFTLLICLTTEKDIAGTSEAKGKDSPLRLQVHEDRGMTIRLEKSILLEVLELFILNKNNMILGTRF